VDIKSTHKTIPELSIYKNVLWKYTGKLSNEEVAKMFGSSVSDPSLTSSGKRGEYIYKFTTRNGTFEIPVKPVFSPKAMKDAVKSYEANVVNKNAQTKIKRTVDITQLGLVNYDVIYHRPDAMVVKVDFKIKNNETMKVKGLPLFHITGEDNVLVNVTDANSITYSKSLNNKFVAILPGRKIAVIGTADFLKSMQKQTAGKNAIVELNEIESLINSSDDLNNIISGL
jgi:hypothetical protein